MKTLQQLIEQELNFELKEILKDRCCYDSDNNLSSYLSPFDGLLYHNITFSVFSKHLYKVLYEGEKLLLAIKDKVIKENKIFVPRTEVLVVTGIIVPGVSISVRGCFIPFNDAYINLNHKLEEARK